MKILFFDYWLKGIANFERLVPELRKHDDIELKMIHVGSWKEPQKAIINQHKGFLSYDICYYKTHNLYKVLKKEKPDVLLILNLHFLMDKALVVFCKKLAIKVIYLSHGRYIQAESTEHLKDFLKKDFKHNFIHKIRIDTIAAIYNYLLSTILSGKPQRFVSSLFQLYKNPVSMTLFSTYTDELAADKILLYYEEDKEMLIDKRNFPDKNIYVVGNPELDGFVRTPIIKKDEFCKTHKIPENYLLYLDDGFVQNRLIEKDVWYKHLQEINDICHRNKIGLVIKLHPRTNIKEHESFFHSEQILAFKQIDFRNIIEHAMCVTSFISTTVSFALLTNKRVISPRWGEIKKLDINYPTNIVHYSYSQNDFEEYLISNAPTCLSIDYISKNIGKADGNSISRIVDFLCHI